MTETKEWKYRTPWRRVKEFYESEKRMDLARPAQARAYLVMFKDIWTQRLAVLETQYPPNLPEIRQLKQGIREHQRRLDQLDEHGSQEESQTQG